MTLTQIRYFIEVARRLNFTEAAKSMFISQQVVSKQITSLENEMDIRLFNRSTKKVELTEAGEVLFESWSELLEKSDKAVQRAIEVQNSQMRKIRIGFVEIASINDLLSIRMEKFVQAYANVDIEYLIYPFKKLVDLLKNKELDVVITLLSEIEDRLVDFEVYPLIDLNLGIYISKKHPLSKRETLEEKDVADETLYVFSKNYSTDARYKILSHCKSEGFEPKRILEFDNINSMELALNGGKGITFSYNAFFRNENDTLKFYPIKEKIGKRSQKVVVAINKNSSKEIENLVDIITLSSSRFL